MCVYFVSMKKKIFKFLNSKRLEIFLLGVLFLLTNVVVFKYVQLRLDITDEGIYTLSPISVEATQKLEYPLHIKFVVSREVPTQMKSLIQSVNDILLEYERAGVGKVILESIDPSDSDSLKEEVVSYGVPQTKFNVIENDKIEVFTGYASLVLLYQDKHEVISQLSDTNLLEYRITSKLEQFTRSITPTVAFLSDHGTLQSKRMKEELVTRFEIQEVTLEEPLEGIEALLLVGPKEVFTDAELRVLDRFLVGGGNLFVLYDGFMVDEKDFTREKNPTNLRDFLEHHGILVKEDIVADYSSSQQLTLSTRDGQLLLRDYVYWPEVTKAGLDQSSAITESLHVVTFPWPSSLVIETQNDDKESLDLVKTTLDAFSFSDENIISLHPDDIFKNPGLEQLSIAALVTGTFTPYFEENAEYLSTEKSANLFVVGNSRFVIDEILHAGVANALLVLNAIDVITQDDRLIELRSNISLQRPLPPLTGEEKRMIRMGNIFGLFGVVFILFIVTYARRSHCAKKQSVELSTDN